MRLHFGAQTREGFKTETVRCVTVERSPKTAKRATWSPQPAGLRVIHAGSIGPWYRLGYRLQSYVRRASLETTEICVQESKSAHLRQARVKFVIRHLLVHVIIELCWHSCAVTVQLHEQLIDENWTLNIELHVDIHWDWIDWCIKRCKSCKTTI